MAFKKKAGKSEDMDDAMARCMGSGKSMKECLSTAGSGKGKGTGGGKKKAGKAPPFGKKG